MIAVIHAYSRANAGDGLLVDLTLERLLRAGVRRDQCILFALDAGSFPPPPTVRQVGMPGRSLSPRMVRCIAELGAATATRASAGMVRLGLLSELQQARAIVAVGGGYLRTGTLVSAFGTLLNHLPQLAAATAAPAPTLYLPQSIGPLDGLIGLMIKACLQDVGLICARDDQTVAELAGRARVRRVPDLAVLQIAELSPVPRGGDSGLVVLVGRQLEHPGGYEMRLQELAERLPKPVWGVQAEGVGSKHDGAFYKRLRFESGGNLMHLLETDSCGVVVSVRLHGALQALAAGVPAIHLSYQRKGWAAYTDLGIDEYVHDARTFDPLVVSQQALRLRSDPSDLWKRMTPRYEALLEASAQLDESVADLVA